MNRPGTLLVDLLREAEVLWGPDAAKKFNRLGSLYSDFSIAAMLCLDAMTEPANQREAEYRPGGASYLIFKADPSHDEFGDKVRREVEEIRLYFSGYLNATGRSWSPLRNMMQLLRSRNR